MCIIFTCVYLNINFSGVMNMLQKGNSGFSSQHMTGWRTWLHSGEQIERNCNDIGIEYCQTAPFRVTWRRRHKPVKLSKGNHTLPKKHIINLSLIRSIRLNPRHGLCLPDRLWTSKIDARRGTSMSTSSLVSFKIIHICYRYIPKGGNLG